MDPFVVVGGDAAGLSAASKCKREAPEREVVVFEKGKWVSYAHCGTPYYVKGEVEELTDLISLTPEEIEERDVALHRDHEVTAINPEAETVTVVGPDGEREQAYGDLLLGTGARATQPFETGEDVFTLHGLPDAAAIRARVDPAFDPDSAALGPMDPDSLRPYATRPAPETVAIVGGATSGSPSTWPSSGSASRRTPTSPRTPTSRSERRGRWPWTVTGAPTPTGCTPPVTWPNRATLSPANRRGSRSG